MNLLTLKGLESMAEKKFEAQADEWVRAIADREDIGYDELRPHIVSLYHKEENHYLEITFSIPEHNPIQFYSTHYEKDGSKNVVGIEGGKLIGNYGWYAYRTNYVGSPSFHGCDNLGHALLISRWAHEGNERAKWII